MPQIATITSKRQLTIPVDLFEQAGFATGQKVVISRSELGIKIELMAALIDKLAGSIILKGLKGKSLEAIITEAKRKRFRNKK